MRRSLAIFILGGFINTAALAGVTVGQTLPDVQIADKGKMSLVNGEASYSPYNSSSAKGKTTVVLTMSARTATSEMNKPFQEALKAAALPAGSINSVTIIRLKEAIFGTKGMAMGKVKDKQAANPRTTFVVDASDTTKDTWGLKKKSYAVIVTDASGKVIRFKDGKLEDAEIADFVAAVKASAGQ